MIPTGFFQHIVELFLLFYEAIGPVLLPPILFSELRRLVPDPDLLRMKSTATASENCISNVTMCHEKTRNDPNVFKVIVIMTVVQ